MNSCDSKLTDSRLLRIHPQDNVLTAIAQFRSGEMVRINGQQIVLSRPVPFGHKIASDPIAAGEKVIKYGVPIGSATQSIGRGEHVHTHNLKSDYLPTYQRDEQERYFKHDAGNK